MAWAVSWDDEPQRVGIVKWSRGDLGCEPWLGRDRASSRRDRSCRTDGRLGEMPTLRASRGDRDRRGAPGLAPGPIMTPALRAWRLSAAHSAARPGLAPGSIAMSALRA